MSNPTMSAATRLRCTAEELTRCRAYIPRNAYADVNRVIHALECAAHRLEGLPSPAPIQQPKVDAPSWGAGVSQ